MKSNDRLYKISLSVTGILIAVGFAFLTHVRLDSPVFLEHYIDMNVTGDSWHSNFNMPTSLQYITNADDERVVIWVEFADYPGLQLQASENAFDVFARTGVEQSFDEQRGRHFGQYSVREVYLEVRDLPDLDEGEELHLTEATVTFSDSSTETVDIGELTISTEEATDSPLQFVYSSSTGSGQNEVIYSAEENLSLLAVDSTNFEAFSDAVHIDINGMDYQEDSEHNIQAGEQLSIVTKREFSEGDSQFAYFSILPQLTVSTENGDEHTVRLAQAIEMEPDYSFTNIYRYLRSREDM